MINIQGKKYNIDKKEHVFLAKLKQECQQNFDVELVKSKIS